MRCLGTLLLLLSISALPSIADARRPDSHVAIAGTRILLQLPKHFEVASEFAGIVWRDAGASIHIAELPAPVAELRASLGKSQLAARGMALLRSEELRSSMGPVEILHLTQTAQGVAFRKWLLIGGDERRAVLLTATAPMTVAAQLEKPLVRALRTALWRPDQQVDPTEGIGFRVDETPDLKIANSMMGSVLLLTQDGSETTHFASAPFVLVARSTAATSISDLGVFARRRLGETKGITDAKVEHESDEVIAGMPAHELVASATAEGSTPIALYQALAFDGHTYFLIQGRVGTAERERYLDQFRKVAHSLAVEPVGSSPR